MIDFPCLCGEKFSIPMDMAGESFQCPVCSRLVLVPNLDDLSSMKPDGTFEMNLSDEPVNPVANEPPPTPPPPRYDPETGQLIRELVLERQILSAEAQKPVRLQPLSKSHRRDTVPPPTATQLFGRLLESRNLAVIFIMFGLSVVLTPILGFLNQGIFLFYAIPLPFVIALLGHYPAIVQETGPGRKDELPAPMRDFDWKDDIWDPFVQMAAALFLAFAPAAVIFSLLADRPWGVGLASVLALAGVITFPAILLTAAADGTLANFRPDRVWAVMRMSWLYYLWAAFMLIGGFVLYLDGMDCIVAWWAVLFRDPKSVPLPPNPWFVFNPVIGVFLILAGLYAGYYGCFLLGLIWRKHHAKFPWIGQVFERTVSQAQREKL